MAKYTPNRAGIRKYLQFDRDLQRELHRRAILGLGVASGLAPRGETHRLAASGEVRDDGPNGGVNNDRHQFSIHFTVPYAVPATYPRRNPLARDYLRAAVVVMERGA
jgi:hypothetical protein